MNSRESGFAGATDHAFRNQPEPSAKLRAAFPVNSSSFYTATRITSHQTAGAIHDVLNEEVQTD